MQDKIQKQILDAFFVVLRPIAKILLRYGIGFREFAEVAKSAFVDVASTQYGIRGRPTNISRVAVMTGLTRKEVRRLRDKINGGHHSFVVKTTPLATILHRWNSEEDFLDNDGRPAVLAFSGTGNSFSELVRRFGGDIPPGAMRTELKRVKAIEENDDGSLRAIRREVYPRVEHEYLTMALMHSAYALLSSIAHNTDPQKNDVNWAQLTAYTSDIRKADLPKLKRISQDRLSEIASSFDDLFMSYEQLGASNTTKEDNGVVAVGVYYFEERDRYMKSVWDS
jgi:Family of unknown function (DUF6502)